MSWDYLHMCHRSISRCFIDYVHACVYARQTRIYFEVESHLFRTRVLVVKVLRLQEEEHWYCCAGPAVVQHGGHLSHAVCALCDPQQSAGPCPLAPPPPPTAASCRPAVHSSVVSHLTQTLRPTTHCPSEPHPAWC